MLLQNYTKFLDCFFFREKLKLSISCAISRRSQVSKAKSKQRREGWTATEAELKVMGDGSRALACWHIGPLVLALLVLSYLLRRQDFVELGQQLAAGEVQWKAPSIALSLSKLAMASSPSLLDTDNSSLAYQAIKFVQSRRTAHIDAGFNYAPCRRSS